MGGGFANEPLGGDIRERPMRVTGRRAERAVPMTWFLTDPSIVNLIGRARVLLDELGTCLCEISDAMRYGKQAGKDADMSSDPSAEALGQASPYVEFPVRRDMAHPCAQGEGAGPAQRMAQEEFGDAITVLTLRQVEVVGLWLARFQASQIAEVLTISEATVHTHLRDAARRLRQHGSPGALRLAGRCVQYVKVPRAITAT